MKSDTSSLISKIASALVVASLSGCASVPRSAGTGSAGPEKPVAERISTTSPIGGAPLGYNSSDNLNWEEAPPFER
jgi:hypothetical protein